jgi:hypothetical protein
MAAMVATGATVPSTLETWLTAMMRVRELTSCRQASRSSAPSGPTGTTRSTAPVRWATTCQGTMLEWCSATVSTISSPACRVVPPQAWATRLIPAVVPWVNTISSADRAFRNRRTTSRVRS